MTSRSSSRKRWNPERTLLDPEFDELGGELTLWQIANPLPEPDGNKQWCKADSERERRIRELYEKGRELLEQHRNLEQQQHILELERLGHEQRQFNDQYHHVVRWCRHWRVIDVQRQLNIKEVKCRCCIPYNGHHTPNYWGTGQQDCW
jgi:hypothetical protein